MPVKSRVPHRPRAWLLGAVTATTGSMIAVKQLAHGLFGQPVQLLGSAANADLDHDSGGQPSAGSPARHPAASSASPRATASPRHRQPAAPPRRRVQLLQTHPGTLLVSPDGSVMAECQTGGAYLLYWVQIRVSRPMRCIAGPPRRIVTFRGAGTVVLHVSCNSGTPVAHLYWPGGGSGGDE